MKTSKVCNVCREEKPLHEFPFAALTYEARPRYYPTCKLCNCARRRKITLPIDRLCERWAGSRNKYRSLSDEVRAKMRIEARRVLSDEGLYIPANDNKPPAPRFASTTTRTSSTTARTGSAAFRRDVLALYGPRCLGTGTHERVKDYKGQSVVHAAHIVPHRLQEDYPALPLDSPYNGLPFRGDIHYAFDVPLFTIRPGGLIVYRPGEDPRWGRRITFTIPEEAVPYLKLHNEWALDLWADVLISEHDEEAA